MLLQQIKRAWYTAKLYKNASSADPSADYSLLDYGFELVDGYVHVKFFEGPQTPSEVEEEADDDDLNSDPEDCDDEVSDDEGSEDEIERFEEDEDSDNE